jgi:hypothetical protein
VLMFFSRGLLSRRARVHSLLTKNLYGGSVCRKSGAAILALLLSCSNKNLRKRPCEGKASMFPARAGLFLELLMKQYKPNPAIPSCRADNGRCQTHRGHMS